MFGSIQWRIAVPFVLLVLVCMGILGFYLVGFVEDNQLDNLSTQLESEANLIATAAAPVLTQPAQLDSIDELAKEFGAQVEARVTIIALDGTVLGDSTEEPALMENHANRPEIIDALSSGFGQSTRFSTTLGHQMLYLAVPVISQSETIGVARVALPLTVVESSVSSARTTVILAMSLAALLAAAAAVFIARTTTKPIRQITRAAQDIAGGELDQSIKVSTSDEAGQLAHAFNEMSLSLKKTVAAISEERGKLATVLANMADGVIMTDPDGNILLANRAAGEIFHFEAEKVTGQPLIEVVRDHEIKELVTSSLKQNTEKTAHLEGSGTIKRFLRVIAVPLKGEGLDGGLVLFQDLSQLRSLQTMRREFIGNVSHELRTPLATIKAIVETLESGVIDDKEKAGDFLERVDGEVDRLTQLVTELTELSRIETGRAELKLALFDINQLVEAVANQLKPQAERQKLDVTTELAPDLPLVSADSGRIRQVLINLFHNAIKFTSSGGRITLATKAEESTVTVSIADTGAGIPAEDLPHIFERFYKADKARSGGGTGLGLAIAKHIVQAHGGNIWAKSIEGKGATFYFRLFFKTGKQPASHS